MATTRSRTRRRVALKRLTAENVMESKPISVQDTATVRSAVDTLKKHCIDMAPVANESGQLVGVISRADLADLFDTRGRLRNRQHDYEVANRTNAGIYHKIGRRHAGLMVRQVMSPEVFRVRRDASIAKVIETVVKRKIRRLFVTDQDAVLVGEIDVFELLRTLGKYVDPIQISHQRPK